MVIAIVIIGGGTILFKNGNNGKEIITVTRENITQEVSVTGKTKAQNEVELGFDTNGRVARVFAVVGDKVSRGQIIAELDKTVGHQFFDYGGWDHGHWGDKRVSDFLAKHVGNQRGSP